MSIFEELEAIDLQSKEVFETSDVDDDFDLHDQPMTKRNSIEEDSFDLDEVRKTFEKRMINSSITDFSDRIDRLDSYKTYTVKEITQNKLNRLRLELSELETQIEDEGSNDSDELKSLTKLFAKLNKKTKEHKLTKIDIHPELSSTVIEPNVISSKSANDDLVQELESKISHLENIIGLNAGLDGSIQKNINDIYRKFKLLSNDKDALKSISDSVDEVNAKLEKSIAVRRSIEVETIVDEHNQIHEIFTKIQSNKGFLNDLPYIMKRLESLSDLHIRASNAVSTVEDLDTSINTMKQDFDSWDKSLTSLEDQLQRLEVNFNKNKEIILSKLE